MRILTWFTAFIAMAASLPAQSICEGEQGFHEKLLAAVRSCVAHNNDMIPKEEMYALVDTLAAHSKIVELGSDSLRVKFVNLQGCIEHVLACSQALGEIKEIIGVIHTPMPATPLCTRPQSDASNFSRAQIIREYLMKGGEMYIVYPQGGLEKRSAEQQKVYRQALDRFPDRLIDRMLAADAIPPDLIGATYIFRNANHQLYAFSIKSRQANDIQALSEWGLWFGAVQDRVVADRINEVFHYLSQVGGPDLRNELDWD